MSSNGKIGIGRIMSLTKEVGLIESRELPPIKKLLLKR